MTELLPCWFMSLMWSFRLSVSCVLTECFTQKEKSAPRFLCCSLSCHPAFINDQSCLLQGGWYRLINCFWSSPASPLPAVPMGTTNCLGSICGQSIPRSIKCSTHTSSHYAHMIISGFSFKFHSFIISVNSLKKMIWMPSISQCRICFLGNCSNLNPRNWRTDLKHWWRFPLV